MPEPLVRFGSFFLCVLMCLYALSAAAPFSFAATTAEEPKEPDDPFATDGFSPALPLDGEALRVTSIDYYYEDENDPLPGLHGGMDITVDAGTEVKAVADGVVDTRGYASDYGQYVILRHETENGVFYSRYAHLTKYTVAAEAEVKRGEVIGLSGKTGQATAPHLHLEIYRTEKADRTERSHTVKYYLSEGTDTLSRLTFYPQPISGKYNAMERVTRLGSGGSCEKRCGLSVPHDHISVYSFYIRAFYREGIRSYTFDPTAEAGFFSDVSVKDAIYTIFDTDGNGHLSLCEAAAPASADLRGLPVYESDALSLFCRGRIATDTQKINGNLTLSFRLGDGVTFQSGGLCGLWCFIDEPYLNLRTGPGTSYPKVGQIDPNIPFRVTETSDGNGYTWGKTVHNGVEGWCVIHNEWSVQLSDTPGNYCADPDGTLLLCETKMPVTAVLRADEAPGAILPDAATLGLAVPKGYHIAYASLPDGTGTVLLPGDTGAARTYFPSLDAGDESVILSVVLLPDPVMGDCDGNGNAEEADVALAVRYCSGWQTDGICPDNLDLNGDQKINMRDLIALIRLLSQSEIS